MKFIATKLLRQKIALLRADGIRQGQLARSIKLHPTRLSEIVHGVHTVSASDRRIQDLCGRIGLPFNEAFTLIEQEQQVPA